MLSKPNIDITDGLELDDAILSILRDHPRWLIALSIDAYIASRSFRVIGD